MNKLLGTSPLIEDAFLTVKNRKFGFVTLIFLLLYGIGSTVGSMVLLVPMLVWMFTDDAVINALKNGDRLSIDTEELTSRLMDNMPDWMTLLSLFITAATIAAVLVYCLKLEKRSAFSLGFHKKGAVTEYLAGLGIGLAMFGAVFGLMVVTGEVTDVHVNTELSVVTLVLFFLGFVVQGASEEILLRSYYFVSGSLGVSVSSSLLISSAVFALLHLANPGISLLSVVNLFLFGVFAALYFLRRGSVWGIAAIHTIWNFAQGNIFGCKVSGMEMGGSVLVSTANENSSLFAGGSFGPEGGLGVTIILVIGIVVLSFMKNQQRVREH